MDLFQIGLGPALRPFLLAASVASCCFAIDQAVFAQSYAPAGDDFVVAAVPSPDAVGGDATQGKPAIISDGTNFFVVWRDRRDFAANSYDIYGARVTADGTVLDPTGIPISAIANFDPAPGNQYFPSVGFDGTNFLVVWTANRDPSSIVYEIYAARVSPDGAVLDPVAIQLTTRSDALRMSSIVFDGTNYFIVWRTGASQIRGARISTTGVNLDGPAGFLIGEGFYPYVAFDGTNYLTTWHGWNVDHLDIFGALISTGGVVLDTFPIISAEGTQDHSWIAFGGSNYLVVWNDYRGENNFAGAYGTRVSTDGTVLDDPPLVFGEKSGGSVRSLFDGTDYLVAWEQDNAPSEFRLSDVYGRGLSTGGQFLDENPFPIATSFAHQFFPAVGVQDDRVLAVWGDTGGRCLDGCLYGRILQKQPSMIAAPPKPPPEPVEAGWASTTSPLSASIHAIWSSDDSNVYIVGEDAGSQLFRFDGDQWTIAGILPNTRKFDLWGSGPADVWTVGWCGAMVTYNGVAMDSSGCQYTFLAGTGLWGLDNSNIFTVGTQGDIFRYDANVANVDDRWTALPSGIRSDLRKVWGTSNSNVYAVGEFGVILHFDGVSWSLESNVPTAQSLNAVWGSGPDNIYVAGDFGEILHYDGVSWARNVSVTSENLYGLWGCGTTGIYAVGAGGTILHHNGISWIPELSGTTETLEDVWGTENQLWAVGDAGTILIKADPCAPPAGIVRARWTDYE